MKNTEIGQLMIEILIGLGVITVSLVASLVVVTHATKLARVARNRQEALRFSEKVLEGYRNTRDLDREFFFSNKTCNNPCGSFGDNNMFSCTMSCNFSPALSSTRVDASVVMSWDDGGVTSILTTPVVLTLNDL